MTSVDDTAASVGLIVLLGTQYINIRLHMTLCISPLRYRRRTSPCGSVRPGKYCHHLLLLLSSNSKSFVHSFHSVHSSNTVDMIDRIYIAYSSFVYSNELIFQQYCELYCVPVKVLMKLHSYEICQV